MRTFFSKKNDVSRKWRSFKKHMLLLVQPFIIAGMITSLWYWAHIHDICFPRNDEVALTGAIITTLAVANSITITIVFSSVWERYQKVVICLLRKDKDTFLCYRDERIPIIVHLVIVSLSLPLLVMIGGLEYKSVWSGGLSIFSVSFVLSLYWIAVSELQNPAKSLWFAERIPRDWLTIDIDEHFKLAELHEKK